MWDSAGLSLKPATGERSGIPHLAKNERDVGHPAMVAGLEPKSAFPPSSTCYRQASLLKIETGATRSTFVRAIFFVYWRWPKAKSTVRMSILFCPNELEAATDPVPQGRNNL